VNSDPGSTPHPEVKHPSRTPPFLTRSRWGWLIFAIAVLLALLQIHTLALNHDAAFFLLEARALAEGRILYQTFADFNMPANAWLALFSLHIARLLHITLATAHQAVLFTFVAASAGLLGWIIQQIVQGKGTVALIAPGLAVVTLLILPGYHFGQREVLLVAGAAPWVAVLCGRHLGWQPTWLVSIVVSLGSAASASLKPHFSVLCAGLVALDLLLNRWRLSRLPREAWIFAALTVLNLAAIAVIYPVYFVEVLSAAMKTYVMKSKPLFGAPLFVKVSMLLYCAGVGIQWFNSDRERRRVRLELAAAGFGLLGMAWAMFLVQGQGFAYHLEVMMGVATFANGLWLATAFDLVPHARPGGRVRWLRPVVVGLALVFVLAELWQRAAANDGPHSCAVRSDPLTKALIDAGPSSRVLALQTGVPPFSLVHAYADFHWTGAFGSLIEMRAIVDDRIQAAKRAVPRDPGLVHAEARLRKLVLLSLTDPAPDLVFVDESQPLRWFETYPERMRILDFLMEDPHFAKEWQRYEKVRSFTSYKRFTIVAYRLRGARE
jgi:hypothetical protein